jgi:tRNA A37 methylthiotransferase MiaB
MKVDSILVNTPVSSPLHPQANLPLLKGYLAANGFRSKIIDTNILFFHWFLGEKDFRLTMEEAYENPLKILSFYSSIEKKLFDKNRVYDGLDVGIRYLSNKYNRINFDNVIASLVDKTTNPFIDFYDELIGQRFKETGIKIVGIAITFQDQIISAFTLASLLRDRMPEVKIVMGGQMITRCYNTMIEHKGLCRYFDYLGLWEGEKVLVDLHRKIINGEEVESVNMISMEAKEDCIINRKENAPAAEEISCSDFTDHNFNDYFFPEMLVPLQTTRGCYATCGFCAIPFGANSYRIRTVGEILKDITGIQDHTLKKYGRKATFFKFMEDTSSPGLLYDLSVEIEKSGLNVKWETFARLEKAFAKPGFLNQLFRGGCRKVHWGLESNDPDVLKNMKKKTTVSYAGAVLELSAKAGILNFCFILVGFPGESDEARDNITRYIIENRNIHTITITTFDLTRGAPMEQDYTEENPYNLEMVPAKDFQVRLPYTINGENWKEKIVAAAQKMMLSVVRNRPDIGFMTLFPDQIRSMYCDRYSNRWGQIFLEKYGKSNIEEMLSNTEKYVRDYQNKKEIDPGLLPEPLRREHFRTKEDMEMIASAVMARKNYENRRVRQV